MSTEDISAESTVSAPEAQDKIAALFDSMSAPNQRVMMCIIQACETESPVDQINDLVRDEAGEHAVFDGPALCRLLEDAGALVRIVDESEDGAQAGESDAVDEEGTAATAASDEADAADEAAAGEPERLVPGARKRSSWLATDAAKAYLGALDLDAPLADLAQREASAWPLYQELFAFLADDAGHTVDEVNAHMYAFEPFEPVKDTLSPAHMLDQAQQAGAIYWHDGWRLSDTGRKAKANAKEA